MPSTLNNYLARGEIYANLASLMSRVPYLPNTCLFCGMNLRKFGFGVGNDSTKMAWVSFNVILGVRKYEIDFESIGAINIIFKD